MNRWIWGGPSRVPLVARCTTHCTTLLLSLAPFRAPPLLAPLPLVLPPLCSPQDYPGFGGCVVWPGCGGGGGLPDAGSGPLRWSFHLGGAHACTPRQGVTLLLYGPSICSCSVQMDLRRNQVLRPFPTPGSGTLWVAGESLRDRRVSCLPRWTVCPTRSPSQDTNRNTCRGECSWSGPVATPPGRCHLGPLTNGPGRIPPYCVSSGGADTVTGGGPKLLGLGPLPASPFGPFLPAPPSAVLAFAPPLSTLGFPPFPRPFLFSQAPALPCFPPAFSLRPTPLRHFACQFVGRALAAWCRHCLPPVSPFGLVVTPCAPPPHFSLVAFPREHARCEHDASTRRGTGLRGGGGGRSHSVRSSLLGPPARFGSSHSRSVGGGGGLAVWLPAVPFMPCVPASGDKHVARTLQAHSTFALQPPCLPVASRRACYPFLLGVHVAGTMRARCAALVRGGEGGGCSLSARFRPACRGSPRARLVGGGGALLCSSRCLSCPVPLPG